MTLFDRFTIKVPGVGRPPDAYHHSGDWGDVGPEDHAANVRALVEGTRLFSVYHSQTGVKFWIITEADRGATTVLLPEDY
jgi:hypothetical protein